MYRHAILLLSLSAPLFVCCADRKEIPRVPATGPSLGAPSIAWDQKNHEERMAFMAAHVEPEMKKLFVAFNDSYESFSCRTCHGNDMELRDFELPNDLYALPSDDPIGEAMSYDEDVANFMKDKVVPKMAELLAKKPGKGGVTCFTCHPKEE